jgi:hypothetical protein
LQFCEALWVLSQAIHPEPRNIKMTQFKKGDLVYWVCQNIPYKPKFWGIIKKVNKRTAYVVSNCHGSLCPLIELVPTTIEQVIAHDRRKYGYGARQTRAKIYEARRPHWVRNIPNN